MHTFYLEGAIGWVSLPIAVSLWDSVLICTAVCSCEKAHTLSFPADGKPTGIPSAWGENERQESLETALQGGVAPAGGSSPFYLSSPCLKHRHASSWCGGYRTALRMGTTCQGSKRSWPLAMLWRQLVSSGLPSERFFYKNGKRNPKRLPKNLYTVSSLAGSLKPGVCPRGQTPHQSYTVSEHNQTEDSEVFAFKQNHLRRGTTYFHFSSQRRETSCCIFRHLKELRKLI